MLVYQRVSCLASTGSTESTESTVEPLTTWQVSAFVVFLSAPLWEPFLRFSLGRGGLRMFKKASAFSHVDEMCSSHLFTFSSNFQDSVHTMVRNRVQITASGLRKVTRSLHHRVWCRRSKVVKTGLRVNGYLMLPANHGQGLKPNGRGWAECWLVQSCSSAMGRL